MTTLDDARLTEEGQEFRASAPRILAIACGAIAREVLAVIAANGWTHVTVKCLPAILHNHPERITPEVARMIAENRDAFDQILVLYADCGTGGQLFDLCKSEGVQMLKGPHCYSFFEGNDRFAARAEEEFRAFYLTDFLVRQFDAFVWRPLGLDRHPQLRDSYFGHYEKLVYQAQTDDPALDAKARDCAQRLGLEYERRVTGFGDLETELKDWVGRASA